MTPTATRWDFVGLRGTQARDVPRLAELQAAAVISAGCPSLQTKLSSYHAVPKSSAPHLTERIQLLEALAQELGQWRPQGSLATWHGWLLERARGKATHLRALRQLLTEGWHQADQLRLWHEDTTSLSPQDREHYDPLVLTQARYAGPDQPSFWGDYWMKTLDPCHRYLPELHAHWEQRSREGESLPPYLLWLEDLPLGDTPWFRYLSDDERRETELSLEQGRLINLKGRPLDCSERQCYLFVIDLERKVLGCSPDPQLCHASFTRGRPVLGSGILQAKDGVINNIKFASGHYLSSPSHWWQALAILSAWGVTWSPKVRVTAFHSHRFISVSIRALALKSRTAFFDSLGLRDSDPLLKSS